MVSIFLGSTAVSVGLTFLFIRLVRSFGWVKAKLAEKTAFRRRGVIPGLGGVPIFFSAWGVFAFLVLVRWIPSASGQQTALIVGLAIASAVMLLAGLWDDFFGLHYAVKLLVQILTAVLLFQFGYRIVRLTHPFVMESIDLGPYAIFATVFWHVLIINAINLIDGLDGLAAGISIIALGVILFLGEWTASQFGFFPVILAGVLSGFLFFNFYPARIFLGDSGSQMVGQFLSAITLLSATKSSVATALTFPVAVLLIPVINVILITLVRVAMGKNPFRSHSGFHLHYKLIRNGFSHRGSVLFLCGISLVFAGVGIWVIHHGSRMASFWVTITCVLLLTLFYFALDKYKKSNF